MLWFILLLVLLFAGLEYHARNQFHFVNKFFVPIALGVIFAPAVAYYLIRGDFTALNTVSITIGIIQVFVLVLVYWELKKIIYRD